MCKVSMVYYDLTYFKFNKISNNKIKLLEKFV